EVVHVGAAGQHPHELAQGHLPGDGLAGDERDAAVAEVVPQRVRGEEAARARAGAVGAALALGVDLVEEVLEGMIGHACSISPAWPVGPLGAASPSRVTL